MVKKQNPSQSLKVGEEENKDEPMNQLLLPTRLRIDPLSPEFE
jgi:hypothetical protein